MPEPAIPKMARYTGNARHMESSQEVSLDEALNRLATTEKNSSHMSLLQLMYHKCFTCLVAMLRKIRKAPILQLG